MTKRMAWLDGLRGLAALYVVLHHAYMEVAEVEPAHWAVERTSWLQPGHSGVAVFIVLSGFCLALQVSESGELRGGFLGYIKRRARRIMPPYYAALALGLAAIWLVPELGHSSDPRWEVALPAFTPRVLASHLILIQNLRPSWCFQIDPPMWSVASEWQIYFAFPALLWAWRRWGATAMVAGAFLVGLVPITLVGQDTADAACPWYLGLFACGVAAALGARGLLRGGPRPGLTLAAILAGLCLSDPLAWSDAGVGAATALFLYYAATRPDGETPEVVRLLAGGPAVALGGFSYSLYLVHYPIQAWATARLTDAGLGPGARLFLLLFAATPMILAVAYGFHLAFERPFLAGHGGKREKAIPDPSVRSPRPYGERVRVRGEDARPTAR